MKEQATPVWLYILAALSASLVSVGLVRFTYTPLLPSLIEANWFRAADLLLLSAANLIGYVLGALLARRLAARLGNVRTLKLMGVLAVSTLVACAFPLSVTWYFTWRLLSGFAGGAVVVLVAATVLPFVPANRRGLASGAVFLGMGLGIVTSGTIVPVLLRVGLTETWLGLATFSSLLLALTWFAWPPAVPSGAPVTATSKVPMTCHGLLMYVEVALMALSPLAGMLFLVNYVARDLHAGIHTGNAFWVIYGVGAVVGPPIYGYVIDRLGAIAAVRTIFLCQCVALTAMGTVVSLPAVGALSFITGTFTSGVVPLILGWLRECIPGNAERQNIVWSKATTVFATSQALGGYAASALLAAGQVNHRMLFLIGAASLGLALAVNLVASRIRGPGKDADSETTLKDISAGSSTRQLSSSSYQPGP